MCIIQIWMVWALLDKVLILNRIILGWAKSLFSFFCKVDTFFSFSPITLLIWIFWVCQISPTWYNIDCSQLMSRFDPYQLQLVFLWPWSIIQRELSSTKLCKPLLTYSISHSTFSTHCSNPFCMFQLHFYLSWNNKA